MDGNISEFNDGISDIVQEDGNATTISDGDDDQSDTDDDSYMEYDTDDEIDGTVDPIILTPVPNQVLSPSKPVQLEILTPNQVQSSPLPLCMMLNARSLYNKRDNFKKLLYEIGPDLSIISETWELGRQSIDELLSSDQFKSISYKREKINNRQPGGGCTIVYNDRRFKVSKVDMRGLKPVGLYFCH